MQISDNLVKQFIKNSNLIEGINDEQADKTSLKAWEFALEKKNKISVEYILKIHKILMADRKDLAGKIRNYPVYIGDECRDQDANKIHQQLETQVMLLTIKPSGKTSKESYAKFCHVHFEKIHPFGDGNGRTGRILYNIHRLNMGLNIAVIKETERQEYYKWFR